MGASEQEIRMRDGAYLLALREIGYPVRQVTLDELQWRYPHPDQNPDWPGWLAYLETGDRGCLVNGGRA